MRDIGVCVMFYTRLPIGRWLDGSDDFAAAQWAAPLAGLLVGLCGGLAFWLLSAAGLASGLAAALGLGIVIVLTGALHEDGLADTVDGFGGGKTRRQKLDIMRDSRLGVYGALALGLSLLIRWAALVQLAEPLPVLVALVAAHTASRAPIAGFVALVPPARSDGLSAGVGQIDNLTVLAALGFGVLALLTAGLGFAVVAVAVLALWFFALKTLSERQIGGQTGDVVGALQQGGEILVLVIAAAMIG
ncbi:MAG: adenosylcobinamide-GDP ribazoletransferase [Rhizobiaceae bacterium]